MPLIGLTIGGCVVGATLTPGERWEAVDPWTGLDLTGASRTPGLGASFSFGFGGPPKRPRAAR